MALLTQEDQYKIYTYYVGEGFQLGTAYLSPLPQSVRGKRDRFSSFNIYKTQHGNLRWKDFGGGGNMRGDALDFIIIMEQDIQNLPENLRFHAALNFFDQVIKNNRLVGQKVILEQASKHSIAKSKKTDPIPHYDEELTVSELMYWEGRPLYISESHLRLKRVYGLRGIDWGNGPTGGSTYDDPAFIFDLSEKGDMSSWKAYRPLTKKKRQKWKSWNLSAIPFEGYYLLPDEGKELLFTSGYKDGMVAENDGWVCGNPTGEGAFRSILPYQNELNQRFERISILFDGDEAGIKAAQNLHELTGWRIINLDYPIKTGKRLAYAKKHGLSLYTKDLAEIVENYNYALLNNILEKWKH